MPRPSSPVDQAFERCSLLARLIDSEYDRARANPTDERYVNLGVIERGEKVAKAKAQIEQAFDDLVAIVEHLTILDMAAALERLFKARIATAVGEARRTLREKHRGDALAARVKLVREIEDFQGLNDITKLISADLSGEMQEQLDKVRENRNRFVHGTDLRNPPTILKEEAQAALNEAVALLKPV
jgi:ribosomal 50S subunit-associated protein YjgA (DUF615 family)